MDHGHGPTLILTDHPVAIDKGNKFNESASQMWLRWIFEQKFVTNSRLWNMSHIKENLDVFDFVKTLQDNKKIIDDGIWWFWSWIGYIFLLYSCIWQRIVIKTMNIWYM